MRRLLFLAFGLAVTFHAVTLGRCDTLTQKNITLPKNIPFKRHATPSAFVPNLQADVLTKARIEQLAQKMGAADFKEFSASLSSEESVINGQVVPRNKQSTNSNESGYFSIRKQRATSHLNKNQNQDETSSSTEYQIYHGVMGKPGRDFPVLTSIPKTKFSCRRLKSGYYADLDTDCQVFHICDNGRKISFLCPNGTIFRQSDQICDWWFKVECQNSISREDQQGFKNENAATNRRQNLLSNQPLRPVATNDGEIVSVEASSYPKQRFNPNSNPQTTDSTLRYTNAHHQSRHSMINSQAYSTTTTPIPSTYYQEVSSTSAPIPRFSTAAPVPRFSTAAPVQRSSPNTLNYKQARTYRTRVVSKPRQKIQNNTVAESQILAESASFTSNSNKRFYNNNQVINNLPASTTTSAPGFTGSYFGIEKNITKPIKMKYSRRPYHARYSSKRLNNTFVQNSSEEKFSYKFNESFAQYTASYNKLPVTTTPITPTTDSGHFITFTYSSTVPSTDNDYRNSRFLPSDSVQNSVSVSASESTTTGYVTPKIDGLYSRVTKAYLGEEKVSTTEIPKQENGTSYYYPLPSNFSDPTIYSPEENLPITTTEKVKYSQSVTKYSPTVPTITPKPPVGRAFKEATTTQATVMPEDNAIRMLHSLDDIEETEKEMFQPPRPGLKVPPSSSPDTLHSLAVYFASASSSTTTEAPKEDDKSLLLSKSTLDQYNQLFNIDERHGNSISSDLEIQQTQGLVQSGNEHEANTSSNIRKLARVFTHALSEYLKDPETFRKVLVEIRPKEPIEENLIAQFQTTTEDTSTLSTTTIFTDHPSITKEEGEVLDFSDVVKTTPQTRYYSRTTEQTLQSTTDDDINPLAVQLNNEFNIINNIYNESPENITSEEDQDYYPVNYQEKSKSTPSPYGADTQNSKSKPFGLAEYENSTDRFYIPDDLSNLAVIRVNDQLAPPYNRKNINTEENEENLQSAYSQSFVDKNRLGKSQNVAETPNEIEDRTEFKIIVTTEPSTTTSGDVTEEYTTRPTTTFEYPTSTVPTTTYSYPTTTEQSTTTETPSTTTETYNKLPENHWSNNLEISRFLQAAVTLDPEIINQELYHSSTFNSYESTSTTNNYDSTTTSQPTTTEEYLTTPRPSPESDQKETINLAESNNGQFLRSGKSYIRTDDNDIIGEQFVLNLPLIPEPLQMKSAKMIFGNLNETSQDIIMEKMRVADKNRSVRKLILLLINTCDLNYNRTLEHARKAILNALINVPFDDQPEEYHSDPVDLDNYSVGNDRVTSSTSTSTEAPTSSTTEYYEETTTYKTVDFVSSRTGKRIDLNTEENGFNFDDGRRNYNEESSTENPSERHLGLDLLPPTENNADKRALELLRSLYSLASRWARK